VDTCILVVSLFKNPLHRYATEFVSEVLEQRRRALIPLTAVVGAFHVATRYLRLPADDVKEALRGMLETRSPALYPYVLVDDVLDALELAVGHRIKSWDGYIVRLAKSIGNNTVFTFDREFEKVEGLRVVNPFPQDLMKQYHAYVEKLRRKEER
jgi:predicted nucleic acid-binding protein